MSSSRALARRGRCRWLRDTARLTGSALSLVMVLGSALHGAQAREPGAPLNAIDWLDRALNAPPAPAITPAPPRPIRPHPRSDGADHTPSAHAAISVSPLAGTTSDSVGLFSAERIGLPRALWGPTPVGELTEAIARLPADTVPSAARLGLRVLMAEFAPPAPGPHDARDALLLARLDRLIAAGALEQASQLIDAVPEPGAALRARDFDIALLMGEEDRACAGATGQILSGDSVAARIFCLARKGDWQTAYAALSVARLVGGLSRDDLALLERFLAEEEADAFPPPPHPLTPLGWRILEALGDPVPTSSLALPFAFADLRGVSGWRAQIEAAERLTRAQALHPNRLFGLYTQRRAAASGGVWERVRAVQALERALGSRDTDLISAELLRAAPLFAAVELETAFATLHAEALADLDLTPDARTVQWSLLLVAQERIDRAAALVPDTDLGAFVMALAGGAPLPEIAAPDMAQAVALGFDLPELPDDVVAQIADGALGRVLLDALALIGQATRGDIQAATRGLQRLRALGLETEARQIAVELLLIERRG
ncbi:MAG: hypothetical protein ACXIU7_12695 [Roseinatronobacter sp.]